MEIQIAYKVTLLGENIRYISENVLLDAVSDNITNSNTSQSIFERNIKFYSSCAPEDIVPFRENMIKLNIYVHFKVKENILNTFSYKEISEQVCKIAKPALRYNTQFNCCDILISITEILIDNISIPKVEDNGKVWEYEVFDCYDNEFVRIYP